MPLLDTIPKGHSRKRAAISSDLSICKNSKWLSRCSDGLISVLNHSCWLSHHSLKDFAFPPKPKHREAVVDLIPAPAVLTHHIPVSGKEGSACTMVRFIVFKTTTDTFGRIHNSHLGRWNLLRLTWESDIPSPIMEFTLTNTDTNLREVTTPPTLSGNKGY